MTPNPLKGAKKQYPKGELCKSNFIIPLYLYIFVNKLIVSDKTIPIPL